jgi:hypothetical protein
MVVTSLKNHCIEGRLIGGDFDGELRTIPRLKLNSGEKDLTFTLTCKQFPVRLCFAMTINKSQGQSFEKVGVDLQAPVFSHGQFYVAVSRVCSAGGLHVLLSPDSDKTENIVWPELLQDLSYGSYSFKYVTYGYVNKYIGCLLRPRDVSEVRNNRNFYLDPKFRVRLERFTFVSENVFILRSVNN